MFCFQCEQTAGGVACTKAGVCGKSAVVSNLQDNDAGAGFARYSSKIMNLPTNKGADTEKEF